MVKLFMVLLGGKPVRRNTEQHDVFFGASTSVQYLVPEIKRFWEEAGKTLHVDGYIAIERVGNYEIEMVPKTRPLGTDNEELLKLFFINLGAYKKGEFHEFHKPLLVVAKDLGEAKKLAKTDAFYLDGKPVGKDIARSHLDDKYAIDDIINLSDYVISWRIIIKKTNALFVPPQFNLGYHSLEKLEGGN